MIQYNIDAEKELEKLLNRELGIIDFDNPEFLKGDYTIAKIKTFFRAKQLMSRYGKQTVNPNFYGKIEISQNNKPIKYLTEEEFKAGNPGYVIGNYKIGKI